MADTDWGSLIGAGVGALGGLFGGSKEQTATSTQAPWGPQQPYLMDMFAKAQVAAQQGGNLTPDQVAAQTEMGKWASGENMNPMLGQNNPYLQGVIDNGSQDVMRNLMPMVNKANAASGSFGNSGVAETYGRMAGDSLGKLAMGTRFADYQGQQGLFENDANRRVAATSQFLGQANNEQQLPWSNIRNYGSALSGNFGGQSTSPYFTNTAANVLGGAGAGSWLGNAIGKAWGGS
jgi:hypothetical protein